MATIRSIIACIISFSSTDTARISVVAVFSSSNRSLSSPS